MNIAVLGKSRINSTLKQQCIREGITVSVLEDINNIESVSGETGAFIIKGREGSVEASGIIVTEEPSCSQEPAAGQKGAISLEDGAGLDALPYSTSPVVFTLDYPVDSPAYMTRTALEKAIRLARRKRKVVYLARFMRTAGDKLEDLYKEARNLGVVFFKYDRISIENTGDEGAFRITAGDKAGSLEIFTHTPVFTGKAAYSDAFLKVVKLLRLKLDGHGHVNEDQYFLYPTLTSRRGVYFTSMRNTSGSDQERLLQARYILSDLRNDLQASPDLGEYAEVDPEKCAFCYTCYRGCPHFAMTPDYENSVMKNRNASCSGCGICSSICPANAITMTGRKMEGSSAGTKERPPSGSLKIFCCENSGEIAFEKIAGGLKKDGVKVEISPVSCGGELGTDAVVSALKDFDRVLVAVCLDNACRHFEGNKRAKRHVERAKEMLRSSGMDENRIDYLQLSHAMPAVLDEYIREMAEPVLESKMQSK